MMQRRLRAPRPAAVILLALFAACFSGETRTARAEESPTSAQAYLLRYVFTPGEILRWNVVHIAKFRTSVAGTSQEDESSTKSTKVWRVASVDADGNATIEHSVDDIEMSQIIAGREQHFNSKTDKIEDVPFQFKAVADTVGLPLFDVTLSPRGEELRRMPRRNYTESTTTQITLVFPEKPIAIGNSWTHPFEVTVPLANQSVRKVQMQERFTLQDVKNDIATVRVATQILTPVHDPELKAQLVQHLWTGTIKFDIAEGRVVQQQKDIDESTVGVRGEASSLHFRIRMTEQLLDSAPRAAQTPRPAPQR